MRLTLALACTVATGCSAAAVPRFDSATALPDEPRRPDGIAVDLTSEPPPALDEADSAERYVTLHAPLRVEDAHETVRAFFRALVREDSAALSEVTTPSAVLEESGGKSGNRAHSLAGSWRERFRKHEYQLLPLMGVYRPSEVRTYRARQEAALPMAAQPPVAVPSDEMGSVSLDQRRDTDIILHVPISTHSIKNERLLGNAMFFWLRRAPCNGCEPPHDRYVIYRVVEDTPP